jgi:hypothetical protein
MLMVSLFAILGACAPASQTTEPLIVTQTKAVPVCPPEVTGDVAPVPEVPDGAVIAGNAAGQGWLSELWAYAMDVHDRAVDAKTFCVGSIGGAGSE